MIDLTAIRARDAKYEHMRGIYAVVSGGQDRAEIHDLLALVDRLTAALYNAEWHVQLANYEPECPSCLNFESQGHETGCNLAELLAEIEGRPE